MKQSATLIALCLFSGAVIAQDYPNRPIRIFQGFAPGGNADNIARVLGATASSAPSAGLGSDVRLAGEGCAGHALVHDDAVLHLAAFDEQLAN